MKLLLLTLVSSVSIAIGGCALFEDRPGPPVATGPAEQVYYATYEEVWRAANLVMQPYPLRVDNMDQGILETDVIRGFRVFTPVYKPKAATAGATYKLTLKVIRGALERKAATKVSLSKDISSPSDFFSDPQPLSSDGLEEKALLYRIGREIQIERALARAQKKQNQTKTN